MKLKKRAFLTIFLFSCFLTYLILNDPLRIKKKIFRLVSNENYQNNLAINYKVEIDTLEHLLDQRLLFVIAYTLPTIEASFYNILKQKFLIDCTRKSRFIDRVIDYTEHIYKNDKRSVTFMKAAGVSKHMVETSVALLTLSVMTRLKALNNSLICNSEGNNFEHIQFLKTYFKNAKFIIYVQDGRDFSYSSSFTNSSDQFYANLKEWNDKYVKASKQCSKLGEKKCKVVKYEELVKYSQQAVEDLEKFLQISSKNEAEIGEFEFEPKQWIDKIPNYDPLFVDREFEMLKVYKYI